MPNCPGPRWGLTVAVLGVGLATAAATPAFAQAGRVGRVAAPQEHSLTTKDGVQIRITYYPSPAGQQVVPVILLHDYNETRAVMDPLARLLQDPPAELQDALPPGPPMAPRAVITVDLRGHGQSKTAFAGDDSYELDAHHFRLGDFQDMVLFDLEAVRSFLVAENDAGRLNLNKLCVVGAGMGANVALAWAARDWSIPPLAVRKQGQDVKALVLLSPVRNFHGLSSVEPLKFPPIQQQVSVFLAYGAADLKIARDSENIAKILGRYHPKPPRERLFDEEDFFVFAPDVMLQGSQLLNNEQIGLAAEIALFIEKRLGRKDFPYTVRVR